MNKLKKMKLMIRLGTFYAIRHSARKRIEPILILLWGPHKTMSMHWG